MQYDGVARKTLFNFFQYIEAQRRDFFPRFELELIGPMGSSDGDGQTVYIGFPYKFFNLLGFGKD
jgi:hypothetical protein